jgi:hypothetical protein
MYEITVTTTGWNAGIKRYTVGGLEDVYSHCLRLKNGSELRGETATITYKLFN